MSTLTDAEFEASLAAHYDDLIRADRAARIEQEAALRRHIDNLQVDNADCHGANKMLAERIRQLERAIEVLRTQVAEQHLSDGAFGSIPDAAAAHDPVEFLRKARAGEDPHAKEWGNG